MDRLTKFCGEIIKFIIHINQLRGADSDDSEIHDDVCFHVHDVHAFCHSCLSSHRLSFVLTAGGLRGAAGFLFFDPDVFRLCIERSYYVL